MRTKYVLGAIVGVLALAFASVAIAATTNQFQQTSKVKFSTSKQLKATGLSFDLEGKDPGSVPPGGDPASGDNPAVKTVKIKLKGARFNYKAGRKLCTQKQTNAAKCPKSSKVGSGSATAHLRGQNPNTGVVSLSPTVDNNVTAYLVKGGFYLVIKGTQLPTTVILKAKVSKNATTSINVSKDVPKVAGNSIILEHFKIKLAKKSRKVKGKRRILFRTPKCGKSKRFTGSVRFVYESGSPPVTNKVSQKCKK